MIVKTHVDVRTVDLKKIINTESTQLDNVVLKAISSVLYGSVSGIVFGAVKSIPDGYFLKPDENTEQPDK